jgi:hypothetical protein
MLTIFSDAEIDSLIHEPKIIPSGLTPLTKQLVERNGHKRKDYSVVSASGSGNEFMIALRQSIINVLDFSAILGYKVPGSNAIFRLRRYNGKHVHTNTIEGEKLNDFHIHQATERYQRRGPREDVFAEVTSRHSTLSGAITCLLEDCGFNLPPNKQLGLFGVPTDSK